MAKSTAERSQRPAAEPEVSRRHVHTWLPRQLVVFGLFGVQLMPWALYLLDDDDHLRVENGQLAFDEIGRRSLESVALIGLLAASVGWLLWTIGAAINARAKTRWSVSPLSAPLAYLFVFGLAVAGSVVSEDFTNKYEAPAVIVVAVVAVVCHLGILAAFRRAAVAIGAPDAPWTRVMVLPLAIVLISSVGAFFNRAVSSPASMVAFSSVTFGLGLLMVANLAKAMGSFDRSCVGRQMSHENLQIPAFLRPTSSS
ncbi:MAG: hypothetical protein HY826_10025 [Actinobacteria bacterium]|nr:hypothetical protein [Actinomycetota bacterium]